MSVSKKKKVKASESLPSLAPGSPQESLTGQYGSLESLSLKKPLEGLSGEPEKGLREMQPQDEDSLESLFQVDYQNNTEADMAAEIKAVETAFAQRAKIEARRFTVTVDSEHWLCISFDTREQKQSFIKATGWGSLEGGGWKYLDGVELCRKLGIPIPATPPELSFITEKRDKTLDSLI
jgi:hypothetical protein